MDKELFNELIESIEDAGAIMRGEKRPSREFHFPEPPPRPRQYAICVTKTEPEFLTYCKVYELIPDEIAAREQEVRVFDDTDECAPYPADYFVAIELPRDVQEALHYSPEPQ